MNNLARLSTLSGIPVRGIPPVYHDDWFEQIMDQFQGWKGAFDVSNTTFPYNVIGEYQDGDLQGFIIELALAGVGRENIQIKVKDEHLIVTTTREDTPDTAELIYHRKGISSRKSQFAIRLSERADVKAISSTYNDGLLRVRIPIAKPEVTCIEVKVG